MRLKKFFLIFTTILVSIIFTQSVGEAYRFFGDKKLDSFSVIIEQINYLQLEDDVNVEEYDNDRYKLEKYLIDNNLTVYAQIKGLYDGTNNIDYYSPGNDTKFDKIVNDAYKCRKYCYNFVEVDFSDLDLSNYLYVYGAGSEFTQFVDSLSTVTVFDESENEHDMSERETLFYANLLYFKLTFAMCAILSLLFTVYILLDLTSKLETIRLYSLLGINFTILLKDHVVSYFKNFYVYFILLTFVSSVVISRSVYIGIYASLVALIIVAFNIMINTLIMSVIYYKVSLKIKYKVKNITISIMSLVIICISLLTIILSSTFVGNYFNYNSQIVSYKRMNNYYAINYDSTISPEDESKVIDYLIQNNEVILQVFAENYIDEGLERPVNILYTDENFFNDYDVYLEDGTLVTDGFIIEQRKYTYDELLVYKDYLPGSEGDVLNNYDKLSDDQKEEFLESYNHCMYFAVEETEAKIVEGCKFFKVKDTGQEYDIYSNVKDNFTLKNTIISADLVPNLSSIIIKAANEEEAYKIVSDAYAKFDVNSKPIIRTAYAQSNMDYAYYDIRNSTILAFVMLFTIVLSNLLYISLVTSKNKAQIMINLLLGNKKNHYLKPIITELLVVNTIVLLFLITLVRSYIGLATFLIILLIQVISVLAYDRFYINSNLCNYVKEELQSD